MFSPLQLLTGNNFITTITTIVVIVSPLGLSAGVLLANVFLPSSYYT